jgi:hypothetical protein
VSFDIEPHAGVAGAAIFGADAAVAPGYVRLDPQSRRVAGYRVDLAGKTRDPETVDHVGACDTYLDHDPCRDMQRSAAARCRGHVRIAEVPVPHAAARFYTGTDRFVLPCTQQELSLGHAVNHQGQQHGNGKNKPAENHPASRRDASAEARATDDEREERDHEREDQGGAGQHDPPEIGNGTGIGACRIERRKVTRTATQRQWQRKADCAAREP